MSPKPQPEGIGGPRLNRPVRVLRRVAQEILLSSNLWQFVVDRVVVLRGVFCFPTWMKLQLVKQRTPNDMMRYFALVPVNRVERDRAQDCLQRPNAENNAPAPERAPIKAMLEDFPKGDRNGKQ
jgi:hypothetical protein